MRYLASICVSMSILTASGAVNTVANCPAQVPCLSLRACWDEQAIESNTIHKLRVPRGGTVDIVATVNPNGVDLGSSTVRIITDPPLTCSGLTVAGKDVDPADSVDVDLADQKTICWSFDLPWQLDLTAREYRFQVVAAPPTSRRSRRPRGYNAALKASVTVEQGVSCYDSTTTKRLEKLSRSDYCKIEKIGKSVLGRDMYLLRVTDWSVPASGKKQLIVIGPYHGDEPSGTETLLDFLHEIITDKTRRHYLSEMVFYVIPSHNPDGHETCSHWGTHKVDPGNHSYHKLDEVPEAKAVKEVLEKYSDEFIDAMAIVHHQWGRDYTLISHMDLVSANEAASWRAIRNMSIRVSNELDIPMYPIFSHYKDPDYTGVRGFMACKLRMPNYTLENIGIRKFNLADVAESEKRELAIYYATIDQMLTPSVIRAKPHATKTVDWDPKYIYKAYRATVCPTIDGKCDEPCWQGTSVITDFVSTGWRPKGRLWDTTIHLSYDDDNLYIACVAGDLTKASARAGAAIDEICGGDGFQMMLDVNLNQWTYVHIAANANGALDSVAYVLPGIDDEGIHQLRGCKIAGTQATGEIEVSIPLKSLGFGIAADKPIRIPIPDGTRWGATFIRNGHDDKPESVWARARSRNLHNPSRFNGIAFMGTRINKDRDLPPGSKK